MAIFRKVHTEFWTDPKVLEEMTPEDKYFMLYLLTNPNTTQIGIYSISTKTMGFELGYSLESVNALMDRFINRYKLIKYNNKTRELAIKNWGKYNLNRGGKPVEDCIKSELDKVKDSSLIDYVSENIENSRLKDIYLNSFQPDATSDKLNIEKPKRTNIKKYPLREVIIFRDESKCFYTGKKLQEVEIEIDHIIPKNIGGSDGAGNLVTTSRALNNLKSASDLVEFCEKADLDYEKILENIKELNDFENFRETHGISLNQVIPMGLTIRGYKDTIRGQEEEEEEEKEQEEEEEKEAPKPKKAPRKKYGEYKNILLTEAQHTKLIKDYSKLEIDNIIQKMDEWIQLHGKTYKDYNLALRKWLREDKTKSGGSSGQVTGYDFSDELI